MPKKSHHEKQSSEIFPPMGGFTVADYAKVQGVSKATAHRSLAHYVGSNDLIVRKIKNKFGKEKNLYWTVKQWFDKYGSLPTVAHTKKAKKLGLHNALCVTQGGLF